MSECKVCSEVITHPLCAHCLEEQIATWLRERNRADAVESLESLGDELGVIGMATTCIKCSRPMNLCSHCYTEHIFTWLRQIAPELTNEFLLFFGFELRRGEEAPIITTTPRTVVI